MQAKGGTMELKNLGHNQTVQLASDHEFRGYVFGRSTPDDPVLGVVILVNVKEAGKTGRHGVTLVPLSDLEPVKTVYR
jgi:hypothetical protein